jgi:CubicO group peptidase (beta-lactamase class C family)
MPGAVIAFAQGGRPIQRLAIGADGRGVALARETLFQVASITKLATALAILRLHDAGALHYEDPLATHLPDAAAARAGVTLRMLLTHTAGFNGWEFELAPWESGLTWPVIAAAALRTEPVVTPGTRVAYNDLDYVHLAVLIERITGESYPEACERLVLAPLGIEGYLGTEPPRPPAWIADVPGPGAGTPLEWLNSTFFRSIGLPASGLITDAAGALALIHAFAGEPADFLAPATRAAATRDQTGGLGGGPPITFHEPPPYTSFPWGLGPALRQHRAPHFAPEQAGPSSFGHSGSSGCVAWADPDAGVAWAILGTRHIATWMGTPLMGEIGAAVLETHGVPR